MSALSIVSKSQTCREASYLLICSRPVEATLTLTKPSTPVVMSSPSSKNMASIIPCTRALTDTTAGGECKETHVVAVLLALLADFNLDEPSIPEKQVAPLGPRQHLPIRQLYVGWVGVTQKAQ